MLRVLVELLKMLVVLVVCLLAGIAGSLVIYALTQVGAPWLGVVIALALAVSIGVHLGNLL